MLVATGCGPSRWQAAFQPAGAFGDAGLVSSTESASGPGPAETAGAGGDADAPTAIEVREIPWDRMARTLEQEEQALTESDRHPEDWSAERALAHRAMLLRGLQVLGDPARIELVGRSAFRALGTVHPLGADRGAIVAQARRVGATDVVVATTFLGRVETVVDRPVTGIGFGGTRFGPYGWGPGFRSGTVWVPVSTEADQVGVVAFFLRRLDAD